MTQNVYENFNIYIAKIACMKRKYFNIIDASDPITAGCTILRSSRVFSEAQVIILA